MGTGGGKGGDDDETGKDKVIMRDATTITGKWFEDSESSQAVPALLVEADLTGDDAKVSEAA